MLLVGGAQDLPFVRTGGAHQPFIVHAGDHVRKLTVAVLVPHLGIEGLKAGGQDHRPHMDRSLLLRLIEIDGLIFTDAFADTAFFLFEVKTALVDISDQGNGLSEIDMDRLVLRDLLVEGVRVFDRAVFDAGRTPRAFFFQNIPGFFRQGDLEIPCLPGDTVYFRIRQDLDIRMPADLDQFGCENSHRAVVGREGLVELGHVPADGRCLLYQVYLEPGCC